MLTVTKAALALKTVAGIIAVAPLAAAMSICFIVCSLHCTDAG